MLQGTHLYLSRMRGTDPCASRKCRLNSSQETWAVPHSLHVKMPFEATERGRRLGGWCAEEEEEEEDE
jgi:hypothetical protein